MQAGAGWWAALEGGGWARGWRGRRRHPGTMQPARRPCRQLACTAIGADGSPAGGHAPMRQLSGARSQRHAPPKLSLLVGCLLQHEQKGSIRRTQMSGAKELLEDEERSAGQKRKCVGMTLAGCLLRAAQCWCTCEQQAGWLLAAAAAPPAVPAGYAQPHDGPLPACNAAGGSPPPARLARARSRQRAARARARTGKRASTPACLLRLVSRCKGCAYRTSSLWSPAAAISRARTAPSDPLEPTCSSWQTSDEASCRQG